MLGFHNRILRIDLTNASSGVDPLSDEVLRRALGGKGLGTYLLLQDLEPGLDPLSRENEMILATGPAGRRGYAGGGEDPGLTRGWIHGPQED